MPKGIPLVKKSEAELRKQVDKEIPYVIGEGKSSIQRRTSRLKQLMGIHGHSITKNDRYDSYRERDTRGSGRQTPRFD